MFKVKFLTNCLECGNKIKAKRFRTFCSAKCRNKSTNKRFYPLRKLQAQEKRGEEKPGKIKCLICGKWYIQVGSHTVQRHMLTGREYREQFELPLKRGVVPVWFRKMKGDIALENGTYKNIRKGKKFWFKKNDKRAIKNTGFKGRYVEVKKLSQEIYPHK
jgi:predicted transcriptional regulator